VAVLATSSAKADITYNLQSYPADQNGHTLSGSITTDGVIGTLSTSDIKSWTVTIDTTTFSSTSTLAITTLQGSNLTATATEITLSAGTGTTAPGDEAFLLLHANPDGSPATADDLRYNRTELTIPDYDGATNNTTDWSTSSPAMGGTDPWVIATAASTVVPEPSTAIVAVFGAVAFLAYGWSRYRRGQRQRREKGTSLIFFQ
jgi:hypothetical protein